MMTNAKMTDICEEDHTHACAQAHCLQPPLIISHSPLLQSDKSKYK